jgi:hypothetical protein
MTLLSCLRIILYKHQNTIAPISIFLKIQSRKFSVILFRSFIIGTSGGEFISETAEPKFSAIMPDMDGPTASLLIKMNSDETRRGILSFSPVLHILNLRGEAEIGPSIIE